ncbi:phage integrase N-terminal SAM-like domain-containing protein [Lewinella sp. LCG006]|uniref:site-specific integrase n=1 Tax=Lewinella sp. LCG006 TaxID=3231911 RepID=UPI0034601951
MKTKEAYQQGLCTYLILKNYSAATISEHGCAFRQFLDWRIEGKHGEDFTPEQARQYLLYRYEQGLKWQTINGDYSAIQKFLSFFRSVGRKMRCRTTEKSLN